MKKEILLDRKEAAAYLGISPCTLRTWAVTKPTKVPYRKVGRKCQYKKDDLDSYIKMRTFGKL